MNPLDLLNQLKAGVPTPVQRLAGQIWRKVPTAINPLRTRQPTTTLGRIGKELNPLNPRNVAILAATEAARAIAGKTLPPEEQARVEYMTFGPQVGTFLNILDAGVAGASPARERELIEQSNRYFAQRPLQSKTQAPPPQPGPRVDASTTQAQFYTRAPQQSPRVIPVVATAPPTPSPISQAALTAAQTGFAAPSDIPLSDFYRAQEQLGTQMAATGELQQRLQESGLVGEGLAEWARANPALAYREIMKRQKQPMPSVD